MNCTARSRPLRLGQAILLAVAAVVLQSALCPTISRAANLAVSKDGEIIELQPSTVRRSPARPPSREAARAFGPEYVGTRYLPPAGEAAGARTESVIGIDSRTRISATTTFPNSAIVNVVMEFSSGSFVCTGWMIDADRVATAAHCIHMNGEFASTITVYPGRDGDIAPFGGVAAINWYVPRKWKKTGRARFDYGVIKLVSNVGDTVGVFGFSAENDAFLFKRKIKVRGYPAEKDPFGSMWSMDGKIQEVTATQILYGLDTSGGQSGAPIFGRKPGCNPCGFGIHTYGTPSPPAAQRNSGTRITPAIFDFLQQAGTN